MRWIQKRLRGLALGVATTLMLTTGVAYAGPGDLDGTFGAGGIVLRSFGPAGSDDATAVALQADGKIVVAGASDVAGTSDFALARFNTDGTPDRSFGDDGFVLTD